MEKLTLIIAIIGTLTSLGLFGALRSLVKKINKLVDYYKEAKEDKTIDEIEQRKIAEYSMEVLEDAIKLYFIITKAFSKKKKS